jgi:hypothetical protein
MWLVNKMKVYEVDGKYSKLGTDKNGQKFL